MTTVAETIPCLVITDREDVHRTNIAVRAEQYDAEPDVGLGAGYEVMRAVLTVDRDMRATIGNRCWIKVQGGKPVEVPVAADSTLDAIDVSGDDLDDEIIEWLQAQAVGFDRDGDAELVA